METTTNSPIINAYMERTPNSRALADQANQCFPSGITHDSRHTEPYCIFVERADKARKWDADGNEYVDYFGGHGALLLGHGDPEVEAAVLEAMKLGTHFGSSHRHEVEWAETVKRMVPSAERVRFTSSGTEATHMAFRLARATTGRSKIVRFRTHFHGWHDHMAFGVASRFDGTAGPGILPSIASQVILLDPGDIDGVREALTNDKDIAALIIEPMGSSTGKVPVDPQFIQDLRAVTAEHDVALIFDEVVTGFRVAPGGAQAVFGVVPDMTTLAKILAGGLPGGAVVGSSRFLDHLDYSVAREQGFEKVPHQGTYNANPVSAVAGKTALKIIETTDACARATAAGDKLKAALNEVFIKRGIAWAAYGPHSSFHVFTNAKGRKIDQAAFDPLTVPYQELKDQSAGMLNKLRLALLVHGVDIMGSAGGVISAVHSDQDIADTAAGFDAAVEMLAREEDLPRA
jgi:glutamate-1-semialdehyde 2,1-aminomutase